ncbi:MAG: hypothetical protein KGL16_01315 [Acidobacteriota bacterium]|nr:hypothetical protein [Acidobacteriota bacterium]
MGLSATLRRSRRSIARVPLVYRVAAALLAALATALVASLVAAPSAALARSPRGGSTGLGTTGGSSGPAQSTSRIDAGRAPGVVKLGGVRNASGDGIAFTIAASGTLGKPLAISGSAPASKAGEVIDIEAAKPGRGNWAQVATAQIAANGGFAARWTPSTSAKVALRAVLAPAAATPGASGGGSGSTGLSVSGSAASAAGELSTSPLTIPIFTDALATLYGPGFWGHHTACGERLTHAMLGVASRTLKCGTRVSVFYRGREITVPVIDRGPFGSQASWDVTMATAKALGIRQTATIGTLTTAPAAALGARA